MQQLKRVPCRPEIEKMMARVVRGDALSEKDVAQVFDQIEDLQAVVSCIGGTPADPSPDSQVSWHALSVMTSNKTLPKCCAWVAWQLGDLLPFGPSSTSVP